MEYKLYDVYEGKELLCSTPDIDEVAAACFERDYDTDGEWSALLEVDGEVYEGKWHYEIRGHDGDRTRVVFE